MGLHHLDREHNVMKRESSYKARRQVWAKAYGTSVVERHPSSVHDRSIQLGISVAGAL